MVIGLNNFPDFRPYSNTQPFTIRDGATYLLQLEALKDWLRDYVIPHINTEVSGLTETWEAQTLALIENWERLSTELVAQVSGIADGAATDAATAEAARIAAEAARDLAEQFASDAEAVQDSAITGIFNNAASAMRLAMDAAYATKAEFTAVKDTVETGRLSATTIDTRFGDKADKDDFDTVAETVNNGRLSPTSIDARFDAVIDDVTPGTDSTFSSVRLLELVGERIIWGNFDELPAPLSVEPGTQFACLDVPELYLNTGSDWIVIGAGGNEIGYAEQIPLTSNASTTPANVAGYSSSFIVGKRPILIQVTAKLAMSVATSVGMLRFLLDGSQIGQLAFVAGYSDVWETHTWSRVIHGLPEGSEHTVQVQLARDPAGTGLARVGGDSNNPNSLKVSTV